MNNYKIKAYKFFWQHFLRMSIVYSTQLTSGVDKCTHTAALNTNTLAVNADLDLLSATYVMFLWDGVFTSLD